MIERTNIKHHGNFCWLFVAMAVFFFSCAQKNYPIGKPYVYKSSVELVKSKLTVEERGSMELDLYNYLDDSLKVQAKSILGFKKIEKPAVFDSANIDRSKLYIKNYFELLGFYRPKFDTITVKFDTLSPNVKNRVRTTIKIVVETGIKTKVDTVSYAFKSPELEKLALESKRNALVKQGDGYSRQVVLKEMDRLVSLYNNKGYFKLSEGNNCWCGGYNG